MSPPRGYGSVDHEREEAGRNNHHRGLMSDDHRESSSSSYYSPLLVNPNKEEDNDGRNCAPSKTTSSPPRGCFIVSTAACCTVIAVAVLLIVRSRGSSKVNNILRRWSSVDEKAGGGGGGGGDALFFDDQLVDHFDDDDASSLSSGTTPATFSQRYYENAEYFRGPGPIFVIMGGEDPLERILYPFVSEHLAKRYGGYTVCIEHRFYGESRPIEHPTTADLRKLLTPSQAMADAIRLVQRKQREFGCGPRLLSPRQNDGNNGGIGGVTTQEDDDEGAPYCPVVTVGASYPGFLASLMRLVHGDVVDIGYGSSVPFYLYSHDVERGAYFEKITSVADEISPGCADAVKTALLEVRQYLVSGGDSKKNLSQLASDVGICPGSVPSYIRSAELFAQEIMLVIASHFAEDNMGFYPPTVDKDFFKSCAAVYQNPELKTSIEKVSAHLRLRVVEGLQHDNKKHHSGGSGGGCFDLSSEQPPGPNGTISAADWSGVGSGPEGYMWDFQSCTLIPECGMSSNSMFPTRPWTLEWLTRHCQIRFGYTPVPNALNAKFGFIDKLSTTASRLLLTNGLHDGWSVASVLTNPRNASSSADDDDESSSEGVAVVNMANGAHHSDLTHSGPSDADTPDVKEAHERIILIMDDWMERVMKERLQQQKSV